MKVKFKTTGGILTSTDEVVIAGWEMQPDLFEPLGAPKKTAASEEDAQSKNPKK